MTSRSAAAYAGLRRDGRLVLVALPASGTLSIPVFDTVLNGTSVIGSIVGTRADLNEVFGLHAAGRTRVSLPDQAARWGERGHCRRAAWQGQRPAGFLEP